MQFLKAMKLVEERLAKIRRGVPKRSFDHQKVAEIEVNKFFFKGEVVNRIMVVLRATGCSHYKSAQGCSMCGHYDGITSTPVTAEEYIKQWDSVVSGKAIEKGSIDNFNINNYKVLCLYNLGSFLNPKEIPFYAAQKIFKSISSLSGIKKVIIESRAEYVTPKSLENIRRVYYSGLVEVGIGLESSNYEIRELCHHKKMPNLEVFINAVKLLHKYKFKALAYVNQKPVFLTEKEAVDDAIRTSVFAFKNGADAVSIEPTSLQVHSLTNELYKVGIYRVPWLWSIREVVRGIYNKLDKKTIDLRIGGYFDEEVLSGSQGVSPGANRNEIFPHKTAGNCNFCDRRFINAIKKFNETNDPKVLYSQKKCPYCYSLWEKAMLVKDSRTIPQRIIDTLGNFSK